MSQPPPTILGRQTGALGYGMLGLTWRAEPKPFEQAIPVMKRALELGADNWNAGEFYGGSSMGEPEPKRLVSRPAYLHLSNTISKSTLTTTIICRST